MIQGLLAALQSAGTAGASALSGMGTAVDQAVGGIEKGIQGSDFANSGFGNAMGLPNFNLQGGSLKELQANMVPLQPLPEDGLSSFLNVANATNANNPALSMLSPMGSSAPSIVQSPLLRNSGNSMSFLDQLELENRRKVEESLNNVKDQDSELNTPKLLQPDNAGGQGVLYENLF